MNAKRSASVAVFGTMAIVLAVVGPTTNVWAQTGPTNPVGELLNSVLAGVNVQDIAPPTFTFGPRGNPVPLGSGTGVTVSGIYRCASPLSADLPEIYKSQMALNVRQQSNRNTVTRNGRGTVVSSTSSEVTVSGSGSIFGYGNQPRHITCDNTTRNFSVTALTAPGQPTFTITDSRVTYILQLTVCDLLGCITGTGVYSDAELAPPA